MFQVKIKLERKNGICKGCLNEDRNLQPLKENMDLFFTLLGDRYVATSTNDSKNLNIYLCWECRAQLKTVHKFRNRIKHAQFILQESLGQLDTQITTLSTLTIVNKDTYDLTLDHDDLKPIQAETDKHIEVEVIKNENIEIKESVEETQDESNFNDIKEEDYLSDNTFDSEPEERKTHVKVVKRKKDKSSKDIKPANKFEKKAKISKNELDFDNFEKYASVVNLNADEIESLIDKESKGGSKLPYNCKECKRGYRKVIDLKRHRNLMHLESNSPFICTECDAELPNKSSLESHWLSHYTVLKCSMCECLLRSLGETIKHVKVMHSFIYTCNVCGIGFCQYTHFSKHYNDLHLRLICDYCGKSLPSKHSMEKHIKKHHSEPECKICSKKYNSYRGLERHNRMLHPEIHYGKKQSELAYCVECDKQYPSVSKYKVHLATAACHTPPKKIRVPCPECGKIFSRKVYMNNHYKLIHMKVTTYHCDICNKYFANSYGLRKHQAFVHEKMSLPKNKICDICGRGFSVNRILINHRRTHTGERPFKCAHCSAAFGQKTALKAHERTQHKTAVFAGDLYELVDNSYGVKPE